MLYLNFDSVTTEILPYYLAIVYFAIACWVRSEFQFISNDRPIGSPEQEGNHELEDRHSSHKLPSKRSKQPRAIPSIKARSGKIFQGRSYANDENEIPF